MAKIKITFPDGTEKEYEKGVTPKKIVESIGPRLAKASLAADVNDSLIDLDRPIEEDADFEVLTFDTHKGEEVFHHSTAHIMAQAVKRIFPKAKLTIGPAIEGGFYYDIDVRPLKPADLDKIEKEMQKIVDEDLEVERHEVSRQKALDLFKDNPYKVEMIKEMPEDEQISYYTQSEFKDLCRGPHVPSTGYVKAFKLTKVSSAYWRGDADNESLQRIYGVSFPKKKQLRKYIHKRKEAEKRDHRKIGKELEWFTFHEYSPGSPFYHKKGATIYNEMVNFMRSEYRKRGYDEVVTPLVYDQKLWETSGHWDHFKDNMFTLEIDGRQFGLKPMNCPSHCLMYLNSTKSYRDLPLRIADFAPLHRNELKGVLSGLTRVRKFSQDDAHIFCMMSQVEDEMKELLGFVDYVYKDVFGMEYHLELSTRPDKAMGSKKQWAEAEEGLKKAMDKNGLKYKLNPGDGAFYGPKIDLHVKDSLDRSWQCATLQLDFNLPERFELTYEGQDGEKHRPVMIHRAIFGTVERFMGVMIEHFAGKLPLWLSPEQVRLLPITDRNEKYAEKVKAKLWNKGIRVTVDDRTESVSKKVRDAQTEKVNYILVIGDQEQENGTVNVRTFHNKVKGEKKVDDFVKQVVKEVESKALPE